ncbi:sulfite exporter TauE/SafE family protein [Gluconobacter albidus]|uniref:sulfite exporter TauE/SafE family protein n=1 Tax=Gluconobacter albidus TaxID=318683 RepID=UPI000785CC20|nr:sulfite exporter TauE/SafE family protein [Gluconobacter albidus]
MASHAFIAFALSAVSGGGAGLVLMPVLGLLLRPEGVPVALSISTAVSSVSCILLFFRNIRWHVVLHFVPPALPAAWVGLLLLRQLEPAYLNLLLGLFLISNLPLVLRRQREIETVPQAGNIAWLPVVGTLAGFESGFTGAVGLLFNRFYHRLGLNKQEIVATRAANDVLLHLVKVVLYVSYGMLDRATLTAGVAMMVIAGNQIVTKDRIGVHYSWESSEIKMAFYWRQHRVALEVEKPFEIEVRHAVKLKNGTSPNSEAVQQKSYNILHVSAFNGIYITHANSPDT